jgi:hypothetical protein
MSIDSNIPLWISELFQHKAGPFLIAVKISFQQIREEKEPEDSKHDEKFNQYNTPKFSAPGHSPEASSIKYKSFSEHRMDDIRQIDLLQLN